VVVEVALVSNGVFSDSHPNDSARLQQRLINVRKAAEEVQEYCKAYTTPSQYCRGAEIVLLRYVHA
jgi:hypothetical protein